MNNMKRLIFLLLLAMLSFGTAAFNSAIAQKQHVTKSGKPDKRYKRTYRLGQPF